jgi:DNA-directed RNA polymerase subunit RPC12/RpoP
MTRTVKRWGVGASDGRYSTNHCTNCGEKSGLQFYFGSKYINLCLKCSKEFQANLDDKIRFLEKKEENK